MLYEEIALFVVFVRKYINTNSEFFNRMLILIYAKYLNIVYYFMLWKKVSLCAYFASYLFNYYFTV